MAAVMSKKCVGTSTAVRAARPAFRVTPKFAQRRVVAVRAEDVAAAGTYILHARTLLTQHALQSSGSRVGSLSQRRRVSPEPYSLR